MPTRKKRSLSTSSSSTTTKELSKKKDVKKSSKLENEKNHEKDLKQKNNDENEEKISDFLNQVITISFENTNLKEKIANGFIQGILKLQSTQFEDSRVIDSFVFLIVSNGSSDILGVISQDQQPPQLESMLVRIIERFHKLEDPKIISVYATFLIFCVSRIDLDPVRKALQLVISQACWLVVSSEGLARELSNSDAKTRKWNAYIESLENKEETIDRMKCFWTKVFFYTLEKKHQECSQALLGFVFKILQTPYLRQFVTLLLVDINFLSRYRLVCEESNVDTLEALEMLIVSGGDSQDVVDRHNVGRIRLLQRVLLKDFENVEVTPSIALASINTARKIILDLKDQSLESVSSDLLQKMGLFQEATRFNLPSSPLLLHNIMVDSHKAAKSYRTLLLGMEDVSLWFRVNACSFETVQSYVNSLQRNIISTPRVQYLSLEDYAYENMNMMKNKVVASFLTNVLQTARCLQCIDSGSMTGWSRMGLAAQISGRSQITVDFDNAKLPPPVRMEWDMSDLVVVCKIVDHDHSMILKVTALARVTSIDANVLYLEYFDASVKDELCDRQGRHFVVRLPKTTSDMLHAAFLLQAACKRPNIIPSTVKDTWVGKSFHNKCVEMKCVASNESYDQIWNHTVEASTKPGSRVLVVFRTEKLLDQCREYLENNSIARYSRIRDIDLLFNHNHCLMRRQYLLNHVNSLAVGLGLPQTQFSCETAMHFYHVLVLPKLVAYSNGGLSSESAFPFAFFFGNRDNRETRNQIEIQILKEMFDEIKSYREFELLPHPNQRHELILQQHAKILFATVDDLVQQWKSSKTFSLRVSEVLFVEASTMTELNALVVFSCLSEDLRRVTLVGNHEDRFVSTKAFTELSVYERFLRTRLVPTISHSESMDLSNDDNVLPGLTDKRQFVSVAPSKVVIRDCSEYQNLAEAEYAVALYQYLVLQGMRYLDIAIVTPFQAQKLLILDVLAARLTQSQFPYPGAISTVDEIMGHSFPFVVVSLTVTKHDHAWHILSNPRFATMLSRLGKHGAIVLGASERFAKDVMYRDICGGMTDRLKLTCVCNKGETTRPFEMTCVEEMGQLVSLLLLENNAALLNG